MENRIRRDNLILFKLDITLKHILHKLIKTFNSKQMKNIIVVFVFLFSTLGICAQRVNIHGQVFSSGGEILSFASCMEEKSKQIVFADENGYFSISLMPGNVQLKFSFAGYNPGFFNMNIDKDTLFSVKLEEKLLGEVLVIKREEPIYLQNMMGKTQFSVERIEQLPSFTATTDIFKAITVLPGISEGKEGYSDFHVRGGDKDENLVLIDHAPVYNTTSTGGFFSLFNPDIIKDADVYKEGFPARFGGRNSSVVDIHLKKGNYQKLKGNLSLGIPNISAYLEGPIFKGQTSFAIGVRASYLAPVLYPSKLKFDNAVKEYEETGLITDFDYSYLIYGFEDVTAKLSHKFNNHLRLDVTSLFSHENYGQENLTLADNQSDRDKTILKLDNHLASVNLSNCIDSKRFWKLTASLAGSKNNI